MRRLVYIFLLVCLPMYGFAMQGSLTPAAGGSSLTHEVEHEQGVYHHHEDDGSLHYDQSEESLDHAQEHSSPSQPADFDLPYLTVPAEQPLNELGFYIPRSVPNPFLDGPQKPPALALGHAAEGTLHT